MSDDSDDYDVSESVRRFQGAGTNISEGIEHLYYGTKQRITNQHPVVQVGVAGILCFGGNWVYNRVRVPVFDTVSVIVNTIPSDFFGASSSEFAGAMSLPVWVQLLGILSGAIIAQNRTHTRKLKRIKIN